jgi:hypothetical protein
MEVEEGEEGEEVDEASYHRSNRGMMHAKWELEQREEEQQQAETTLRSLQRTDDAIARIYRSMPPSALLVVMVQGGMERAAMLAAKRVKSSWRDTKIDWTDFDEQQLREANDAARGGAVFMAARAEDRS